MIENNLALRQPFEQQEAREPTRDELHEAEQRTLEAFLEIRGASSLSHVDGRTWVHEALCEAYPSFIRDLAHAIRSGYPSGEHDDAEIGRLVREQVDGYIRALNEFDSEVDRQLNLLRQDRAEMARADDEFEATL